MDIIEKINSKFEAQKNKITTKLDKQENELNFKLINKILKLMRQKVH